MNRIPLEYRRSVLGEVDPPEDVGIEDDPHCLATLKHFRSLIPMGREARKPIFSLTVADGAIGSHAQAAREARRDFRALAERILERVGTAARAAL